MEIENNTEEMYLIQKIDQILQKQQLVKQINELREEIDDEQEFQETLVFELNLDEVRKDDGALFQKILLQPTQLISLIEKQIKQKLFQNDEIDVDKVPLRLSFIGNLGKHTVSPRGLRSNLLNKLIKIKGIVTYQSQTRVRLMQSGHYCENTKHFIFKDYYDSYKLNNLDNEDNKILNQLPINDTSNERNPLTFEFGLSSYKDFQILGVQEKPENVPMGQLSRSIQIFLQQDLVDKAKPGDRVEIIGIFKPVEFKENLGIFRPIVLAYDVQSEDAAENKIRLDIVELKHIKKISQREDIVDLFSRSLAPSIEGHKYIKEGLLLMLLGGKEIITDNNSKIRGDINILLIGDPGTGKSQFLRRIMELAPLCFNTTGRGSTGVGLTAAIVNDKESGEKKLEAGAMVLADRGIICVDEFDKMNHEDRVSMHEVMEQQTVTIAKAGIHISLNARCSVLAAANPVYGEYLRDLLPSKNIGMPDTLLSRFDLIYVVQDKNNNEKDRRISKKVTLNHQWTGQSNNSKNYIDGTGIIEQEIRNSTQKKGPFQQFNKLLHQNKETQYLDLDFLKNYIAYAKQQIKPKLTEETSVYLSEKWCLLRQIEKKNDKLIKLMPISIRSLEGLIRLSTAYAKLRLSKFVEKKDVVNALYLFTKAFYGGYKLIDKNFFKKENSILQKRFKKSKKKQQQSSKQTITQSKKKRTKQKTEIISPNVNYQSNNKQSKSKMKLIYKLVYDINQGKITSIDANKIYYTKLWDYIQNNLPNSEYALDIRNKKEFDHLFNTLVNDDKFLIEDDIIYMI